MRTPFHLASALAVALAVPAIELLAAAPALADDPPPIELKFGTLAPDNTPWSDILKNFKKSVQKATQGRVKVKLFLGPVLGDEAAMLQKMKFGQLNGGGFSTGGISTVVPELQIFEVPFLFNDDAEADHIMDEVVLDDMRKLCEARGLFLYIWAVNGWHDLGCKDKAIERLADVKGMKAHMQETDLQHAFWAAVGANPVPLPVPEVLGGLQRGMVSCFSSTPIYASASQWFAECKHWTDSNHIYQPAAVVFDLKWWNGLSEDLRKTILSFAPEIQKAARNDVRGSLDKELMEKFRTDSQIAIHTLGPEAREEFRRACASVPKELIEKGIFTQELWDKVVKGLEDYRARKKDASR